LLFACNVPDGEERVLGTNEVAAFELLTPTRRLPSSARDVRVHVRSGGPDTSLKVRFEATLADARQFAESLIGHPLVTGEDRWRLGGVRLDWWPETFPAGAESGRDGREGCDFRNPPVEIMLVPRDATATVWLHTFSC
jgi:hypothetical protein